MSEPMTTERLEELRKGVATCKERGFVMSGVVPLEECIAEIDRLRAENAALLKVAACLEDAYYQQSQRQETP